MIVSSIGKKTLSKLPHPELPNLLSRVPALSDLLFGSTLRDTLCRSVEGSAVQANVYFLLREKRLGFLATKRLIILSATRESPDFT